MASTAALPSSEPARRAYDSLPYPGYSFRETHPDHLGAVAALYGLITPGVEGARILELGCGCGTNLAAIALSLPAATCVGVDISSRQIEIATKLAVDLQLSNLSFHCHDFLDYEPARQSFDYIICHGVFSWVPIAVRERILSLIRDALSGNGVAYVSYNTFPAWQDRLVGREMMLFHLERHPPGSAAGVKDALDLLRFAAEANSGLNAEYEKSLKAVLEPLVEKPDWYVAHEYLEETNEPLWFSAFASIIDAADLQYLGDARPASSFIDRLPQKLAHAVEHISWDRIAREQHVDLVVNRSFRRSLVCSRRHSLTESPSAEAIRTLSVGCPLVCSDAAGIRFDRTLQRFDNFRGPAFETAEPLLKHALAQLSALWPAWVSYTELEQSLLSLDTDSSWRIQTQRELPAQLLNVFAQGGVELHRSVPAFVIRPGEQPTTSPLARQQARTASYVTNLRQETVSLGSCDRLLLALFDGSSSTEQLRNALHEMLKSGAIAPSGEHRATPAQELAELLLAETLERLCKNALLVA
ncbi:MAG: class I SAM-dependent methyltransferase [Bdellovibrionales bacterium]|nr:class I SAM-dependent methyltransferase [Bdellovibrionales bacterium]